MQQPNSYSKHGSDYGWCKAVTNISCTASKRNKKKGNKKKNFGEKSERKKMKNTRKWREDLKKNRVGKKIWKLKSWREAVKEDDKDYDRNTFYGSMDYIFECQGEIE